jgi:hypothetical protein
MRVNSAALSSGCESCAKLAEKIPNKAVKAAVAAITTVQVIADLVMDDCC